MEEERLSSKPKWINPCGIRRDQDEQDTYTEVPQVSEKDLLTQIIAQANIALTNAKQFQNEFALKTFNSDPESLHTQWQANHYDWLPLTMMDSEQIPELNMKNSLIDIYEHLQKFAVGLEQIVWDQEDNRGAFLKNFTDTEYNLRSLLCEIQMAIIELGLSQKPDITRDLMGPDFRSITDATERNLRDWLIYRDYMSALDYTVKAFGNIYATF
ncbi:PREDICTED: uncharacterized protein LOC108561586 [Nicrophorus vespilloides]|uniref:Uncharacterized protein LOC108561586 n=1 Tax=Nicrophorus vespilloides TaxID=110193 RepID=A0ABM1MKI0_NICVS|nr:PREDICTED: uncharacterized protein LOC108561586 [Nicrophorus vespilloides]